MGGFAQLAWSDKRTTSGTWRVAKNFPICRRGSSRRSAARPIGLAPRCGSRTHEFKTRTTYGKIEGANLLDWPMTLEELEPYYTRAEDKMGVTRTDDRPGLPGNNNFKVFKAGANKVGYQECTPAAWRSTRSRATAAALPADRLLLPGLQMGREMVDALYRNSEGRGHRQTRSAARKQCAPHRA